MRDFWAGLPIWGQETLILIALLLPLALIATTLLRGLAPWPLAFGMIRRFAWINAVFVALIAVSVGMGIGLIAQERGLRQGTADAASKFDLVVSAPGSETTMLLAAVYLRPADVPLIDGETFNAIAGDDRVRLAAPIAFGDSFEGDPIVGTVAEFVTHLSDGAIEGRVFATEEEAVVGALVDVPVGGEIEPAHGRGTAAEAGLHGGFRRAVRGTAPSLCRSKVSGPSMAWPTATRSGRLTATEMTHTMTKTTARTPSMASTRQTPRPVDSGSARRSRPPFSPERRR